MNIIKKAFVNVLYYVCVAVKKFTQSDLAMRAFHTFWQTALTVWVLSNFSFDLAVLGGAAGAGFSAVKGVLKQAVQEYRSSKL